MTRIARAMAGMVALVAAGCGGENQMMTGPGDVSGMPAFLSVTPRGGATGVPVSSPLELHWGVAMSAGMEQFVDLHRGDLSGPTVPMGFAWSGDGMQLVCTPVSPLQPETQYVIHVGGGMVDADGELIDMDEHGPGYGGQWIQGGMMGAGHAGMPWGMMGGGWQHGSDYGMAFTFTTR
ncbi:MAG: Ig-like domain-containing protein [Acidobacteriota bacterium]